MSLFAICLVLAAALCHATWNLVAKKAGGGNHFVLIGSLLVTLLWLPVVLWVGVRAVGGWGWLEWLILAASALVHVFYFRALLHGYQVSDLSVVYPVARGSGPLLSSLGAVLLLGECVRRFRVAGAGCVVGESVV